jgi:secreted protein with Ig-like and vWFA domain
MAMAQAERRRQEQQAYVDERRRLMPELALRQDQLLRERAESSRSAAVPAAPPPSLLPSSAARPDPKRRLAGTADVDRDHASGHAQSPENRDRYASAETSPVKSVATEPVSTFSIDVDTASYSVVRRHLNAGRLPPREAVRVEEIVNYFPYAWPAPDTPETPFRPTVTVLPSPWNPTNKLVHIAIKGYSLKAVERRRANLVLLVDVSGSMAPADRLPLLKNAFRMLLDELKPEDTVAIVTYASGSDIRLKPTKVADKLTIIQAIDSLNAGGSTHGAAGIQDAYTVAEASFDKTAVNRVILATDGDWNVGITDRGELKSFIESKRKSGIYLSILGVGMGNHNDRLMQALAQNGNGVAAYIDTLAEARKVLVEESASSLFPIANDVKIQVEFNPARVAEYRLIGYETRALRREDFNNDKVDAGDIGSGHSVTAIYEITPVGAPGVADGLRYGKEASFDAQLRADEIVHTADTITARGNVEVILAKGVIIRTSEIILDRSTGKVSISQLFLREGDSTTFAPSAVLSDELSARIARAFTQKAAAGGAAAAAGSSTPAEYAFLKLRYKRPGEDVSKLIERSIGPSLEVAEVRAAPVDVRFSIAAAAFGQMLAEVPHLKAYSWDDVIAIANAAKGDDPYGYRAEMVALARLAKSARR